MHQVRTVWANLDKRKQILVIMAALGLVVCIALLSRIAATPSMQLLYAGLENGAAGDVVRALEQRGTAYEVRGGSIYVSATDRDELRMTLASEALPANGGRGYELLDNLNGFGTTSQMFDAAYWRAKEGELARTIVASPHMSHARVHIATNSTSPFQRNVEPTASVAVTSSGGEVTTEHANAIRFLVASAVTGLKVDNVAIIDANGTVIGATEDPAGAGQADDRADRMRERVLRLLEARVGRGNAVVELSLDTVTETESIRERRFDPNSRVAISTDVEERADSSNNSSSDVTIASNLPDGDGAAGDESNSNTTSSRERVNYEVSETELEVLRVPGAVKRLTVAVLVNAVRVDNPASDPSFEPRPEAELEALRELVASAVGFEPERGDVITLKSMELPVPELPGTTAAPSFWQAQNFDMMNMIQVGTLAFVSLVLGFLVVRPILMNAAQLPAPVPPALTSPPGSQEPPVLTGEIHDDPVPGLTPQLVGEPEPLAGLPARSEDTVHRLRQMIGDRQEETVEILRNWLEDSEENA